LGFLAPWFLGGLAILGLPVYVHLLRQYRQKPVPFSSLMFFERRTQSSIKHRRLKYLLLFALRCAFVALLALAFARPYVHSTVIAHANGGRTMVFAIDNSFSMRQGDRFSKARQDALTAIASMREDDRGQVISFGGPARLLTDMTDDKQALRAAATALEPGDGASSYADLSRVFRSTAESLKTKIDAYVFTDLQKSSLPPSFSDLRLADGTKLEVHAEATAPVANWTVENVDAPVRVFDTKKVRTVATVAGFGTPEAIRHVTLLANNKVLESKDVKVPASGRATVEFLALDAPYGLTRCEIRIDAKDQFPNDDHWYFSVERADPKPALLVTGENDAQSALYVRTALESASEAAFKIETVPSNQAGNVNVAKYAFVILDDPGPLSDRFESALENYIRSGGYALVATGRNTTPGRKLPATDIYVVSMRTAVRDEDRVLTVASVDQSYPSFARGRNWDNVTFYQVAKLQLPPESPETRVAAKLSDGSPLLVDRRIGDGHVLIFTSAFDNIANNLPLQPVWLPFLDQTTREMGGIGSALGKYNVGSFVELRTAKEKNIPVEIIAPGGTRALTLSESPKAQTFQFPGEGFYDIRRANGREELAAVNPDRKESDFALVPAETVTLWKNTGLAPEQGPNGTAAGGDQQKTELWWWVLAMLAILAVAESVLGNRYLSPGKETA
jgi:hypothetical protein